MKQVKQEETGYNLLASCACDPNRGSELGEHVRQCGRLRLRQTVIALLPGAEAKGRRQFIIVANGHNEKPATYRIGKQG